jgi:hypothetical protein
MRQLKLLSLVVLAVFGLAAVLSASASALELPENLPVSAVARNFTGASESEPELIGKFGKVKCKSATGEGTEEAGKPLGLIHITFKECKESVFNGNCNSEGDAAGVILALFEWHLVWDLKKGAPESEWKLATGFLYLINTPIVFKCPLGTFEVKGQYICLHLKPEEKNKTHSYHCIAESNKATEEWCMKDKEGKCFEQLPATLLTSINKGAFEESAELALGNVTGEEIFSDV